MTKIEQIEQRYYRCEKRNCEHLSKRRKCKIITIGKGKAHPYAHQVCECPLEAGNDYWKELI
jgi:hypothetical protein